MRAGDAERIATFAAATRDRHVQLLAGDYLRRGGAWRARPHLARHVLQLYSRARAHAKLAAFHADCAKLEIDDYEVLHYETSLFLFLCSPLLSIFRLYYILVSHVLF